MHTIISYIKLSVTMSHPLATHIRDSQCQVSENYWHLNFKNPFLANLWNVHLKYKRFWCLTDKRPDNTSMPETIRRETNPLSISGKCTIVAMERQWRQTRGCEGLRIRAQRLCHLVSHNGIIVWSDTLSIFLSQKVDFLWCIVIQYNNNCLQL